MYGGSSTRIARGAGVGGTGVSAGVGGTGRSAGFGATGRTGGVCAPTTETAVIRNNVLSVMRFIALLSSVRRNVGSRCAQPRNDVALLERAVDEFQIHPISALEADDLHQNQLEILEQSPHGRIVGGRRVHEQTRTRQQVAGASRELCAGASLDLRGQRDEQRRGLAKVLGRLVLIGASHRAVGVYFGRPRRKGL